MKRGRIQKEEGRLLLYILFFASYLSPFAIAEETLVEQAVSVFQHGDVERRYVLHLPEDLPAQSPLVFFLHGYYGDARDYAELGMNQVADTHKFAVVYPQGKKDTRGVPHWNARLSISKVDDIDFLTQLAKELQQQHDLNAEQTFASDVSNGGFMSYTLVAERPETFKAAASIIGTMSGYTWEHRNEIQPAPILQISGLDDEIVPVDGSMSSQGGWGGAPDQRTIIDFWRTLDQTKSEEIKQVTPSTKAYRYGDGVDGCDVWLYEVTGWGHRVPGKNKLGVPAVELVWMFFSRY